MLKIYFFPLRFLVLIYARVTSILIADVNSIDPSKFITKNAKIVLGSIKQEIFQVESKPILICVKNILVH